VNTERRVSNLDRVALYAFPSAALRHSALSFGTSQPCKWPRHLCVLARYAKLIPTRSLGASQNGCALELPGADYIFASFGQRENRLHSLPNGCCTHLRRAVVIGRPHDQGESLGLSTSCGRGYWLLCRRQGHRPLRWKPDPRPSLLQFGRFFGRWLRSPRLPIEENERDFLGRGAAIQACPIRPLAARGLAQTEVEDSVVWGPFRRRAGVP